jgi:hypothetical protein
MHHNQRYMIPKTLRQVTLWVHPEGRVIGSLFLSFHTKNGPGVEDPCAVLNEAASFLVLQRAEPEELRFYNKRAIIRVEYPEEETPSEEGTGIKTLHCQVSLMDGSLIEGVVRYPLPPNHERLYDYLNLSKERFAKLYLEDGNVCLVNKAYIVCVSHLTAADEVEPRWLPEAVEISETSA